MIDLNNLTIKNVNPTYYFSSGVWVKPRGITNVQITAIGAGGGGGGGGSQPSLTNKGAGGGGASGGLSRVFFPAYLLPDILNIRVGIGGDGGAPQVAGSPGGATIVELPNSLSTAASYFLLANGGGGGGLGSNTVQGTRGTPAAVATTASAVYVNLGIFSFDPGYTGSLGGGPTGSPGETLAIGNNGFVVMGGCGGGSSGSTSRNNNGGGLTGAIDIPSIAGGTITTPNGTDGFYRIKYFYSTGGAGGRGNDASPGGNGGNGAPGSGGGGGGAGTTGGTGGKGGDGLVIITCW